eukprot:CAMPEP_0114480196 /NCGR_PEP_ID=MMETSP0104-20121206/17001_1 /TAXON_ID=37642 ORGANISM="Paraphysomonas imperforata, Strain PA2" /NCGR_SAMPLE_ID=MMETSP0104 /ASSEMBLY_ACC=CAM_ASM_000202 /LENGTH=156 /DNA_ID=CAMNT_0001655661 /DNA_START=28 /DNA_END=495 /DNA_ORIENTATION=+
MEGLKLFSPGGPRDTSFSVETSCSTSPTVPVQTRGESSFLISTRHKSSMDKRNFVFCLHARGQSRQELILSAVDFSELSLWENMINTTVEKLKRKAKEIEAESRDTSTGIGRNGKVVTRTFDNSDDGAPDADAIPALKRGKLEKCGRRVKTWTTRW